ncbi:MAG: ferredoxin [Acidimicrobiia bacterium]|nr:ferredoxin [Acidimicrobiia bacterium]
MHISVDRSICTGHGRCYVLAPDVYEPDDDGYCVVIDATVGDHLAEQALVGARNCPEDAITVRN